MKKLTSILLALVLLCSCIPAFAVSDCSASYKDGVLYYSCSGDTQIEVWLDGRPIDSKAGKNAGEGMPFGPEVRKMLDLALKDASDMGFETAQFDGYAGHVVMGEGKFVVRHIKRINNAPAWNRAGREEQIYSRF